MPLGLDLSHSTAKIARACDHLESLDREMQLVCTERNPYTYRMAKIDPQGGWYSISIASGELRELGLGILVGDLVHNLRCALDYIVAALVEKSSVKLATFHQFPIFMNPADYFRKVGTDNIPVERGYLSGIRYGLKEIWDLQPFHRQVNPHYDALFLLNYFSNADKHRVISDFVPQFHQGLIEVVGGSVAERIEIEPPPYWGPNQTHEIARVRFDPPVPIAGQVGLKGDISVAVYFGAPAFGNRKQGVAVGIYGFKGMCEHVAMIVDAFEKL